jgi:integrase
MPNRRINKRTVDALHCPAGQDRTFLWDTSLSGFGVVAYPGGRKVYVAQFRLNGQCRRLKLATHGRKTPDEARSMAKKVLGAVEDGKDPIEQRRLGRDARTLREISEDFLKLHVKTKRKTRTYAEYERLLKLHLLPVLGSHRLISLRKVELARFHAGMSSTPAAANRAIALFSSIWHWAAARDEVAVAQNPAAGIERYPERGRERYLSHEELGRLGDALRLAETAGIPWVGECKHKNDRKEKRSTVVDPHAVAAIRLLMFTGARLREILTARWDYVDWDHGLLLLPDSKTGRKTIYLAAPALALLHELPRIKDNPHIIPGKKKGSHRADLHNPWSAVSRSAGLEGVRLHDLRHSFASVGAGASLGLQMIGKLLGHAQAETTARYAHLDASPVHTAVNLIGSQIAAAMGQPVANVISFPQMKTPAHA